MIATTIKKFRYPKPRIRVSTSRSTFQYRTPNSALLELASKTLASSPSPSQGCWVNLQLTCHRVTMASISSSAASVLALAGMALLLSAHAVEAVAYSGYEKFGPFYQHDVVSRPNFTSLLVSRGYTKTEGFGSFWIFDDVITVEPDIQSGSVARVQGSQTVASLDGSTALIIQTLLLPGGTLTFLGHFSVTAKTSVYHCVGGSGEFESVVHGIFEVEVHYFDEITLDTVLKVTAYFQK